MQEHAPVPFNSRQLTTEDQAYLEGKERIIKGIVRQAAAEVGKELTEVDQWFKRNHKWGFEQWVREKCGYTPDHARSFMTIAENLSEASYTLLPDMAMKAQLQIAKAPDPPAAVDEAALWQEIEGKVTERKAKEIAAYQRAIEVKDSAIQSWHERAKAADAASTYKDQQIIKLKEVLERLKAEPVPQVREVERRVEVTPPQVTEKMQALERRMQELVREKAGLEKERNSYRRDLEKERESDNARFLQGLGPVGEARKRANFNLFLEEAVRMERKWSTQFPSIADVQCFGAEEWQRLGEFIQVHETLLKLAHSFSPSVAHSTPYQQIMVVDSAAWDEEEPVKPQE